MLTKTEYCTFHSHHTGPAERNAVLFLHGFLGSGNDWLPLCDILARHYRCILPDLPGHGRSTWDTVRRCTFSDIVDATAGFIEQLATAPLHIAGYSMGGRIALALALRRPELVSSLAIMASSPGIQDETLRNKRLQHDRELADMIEHDFEAFLRFWYSQPLFASLARNPDFPKILEARKKNDPKTVAASLRCMTPGLQPSLWKELGNLSCPILFMAGEKDTKYVEIGRQLVNLSPHASLEIIPGCGHALQLENTTLAADRLQHFFNTQDILQP
ncbi:2-succinyl-6-hydroxy-2,4-cyclohexadiene-1-carboxylate synthase [Prosthecochloris vibrioformis]|uniref:Putative 2-succinyl-6-hydroxy-2,4-cyclohexadiene-1-carboxylate synthase n=1 Tax=Prosthecochloris vibrioformis TaxID=1098 RepID=A0A5C4S482_PROVB|nr:2-succinyl-6-hydroxy-2,4-cyclohexadiene-1-carboxylate synthase [Prosthecochloris vibrioformis]TNJ37927.1 2-succinyl-6-hydroxy-2,4-cyclohexadiene-1-carboxylate synthase [Prosthecochloris vibrioformis]